MNAMRDIENEKQAAIVEVKNKVGMMATEIAEKIIKKQLSGQADHESFVSSLVKDIYQHSTHLSSPCGSKTHGSTTNLLHTNQLIPKIVGPLTSRTRNPPPFCE